MRTVRRHPSLWKKTKENLKRRRGGLHIKTNHFLIVGEITGVFPARFPIRESYNLTGKCGKTTERENDYASTVQRRCRYAMERKSGKRHPSRWLVWFDVDKKYTQKSFRLGRKKEKKKFRQTELEEVIKKETIPGILEEAIEKQWRREFRSVMFTLYRNSLHPIYANLSRDVNVQPLKTICCLAAVHLFFHARDVDR